MSAWFEGLLGRILSAGSEVPLGGGVDFRSGLYAEANAVTQLTEVGIDDNAVTPAMVAPEGSSMSVPVLFRVPFTAGVAGTADDVTVTLSAPFAFTVADAWVKVTTAIGGSTLTLRSASGGLGSALSSAMSSASAATVRNNDTEDRTVAANGSVYLRRSDRGVAGVLYVQVVKT
jgi:hypothetical protein